MVALNSDGKNSHANPPSSRPMTLRQQVNKLYTEYWHSDIGGQEFQEKMVELCQEIAREAVDTALKTERKAVLGYSNDMKIDRALALAEKSGYEKCEAYHKRKAELTQKPPQPQGADE